MGILLRRSLVLLVGGMALAWYWLSSLVSFPVRADVGVQPILPGGSSIKPEEETPIQMTAEQVVMTVRAATEEDNTAILLNPEAYGFGFQPVWYPAMAEVEADFTMKNPTTETVSMTAWFPLASALENVDWELNPEEIVPRIESFQISVDGEPVDISFSELPNPKGEDKPLLPWASFPVTFPAGQETNLHVSYVLPLQPSVKGNEMALYYIFQTGVGWAGPIGQAELIVNLPYPASNATMAGMRSGSLRLPPYYRPKRQADLPAEVVFDGNQARWTWKDFEPGPEDDFAIWLIQPSKWQELESARADVQANPNDGQAWLNLASVYRSVATSGYNQPSLFADSYLSQGIEAYQKAAELLPEHPTPHSGLALLTLAPYMDDKNAPQDLIQSVQGELNIARELEAKHPNLAEEAGLSSVIVADTLSNYAYNDATATADWAAWSTIWAQETAEAEATLGLPTASLTPPPTAASSVTVLPSRTPEPSATLKPVASPATTATVVPEGTGFQTGGGMLMCIASGVLGLSLIYVLLKLIKRR